MDLTACIPNMIKFHEVKSGKKLRFNSHISIMPSIAMSIDSIERDLSPFVSDKENKQYFLYNSIQSVDS